MPFVASSSKINCTLKRLKYLLKFKEQSYTTLQMDFAFLLFIYSFKETTLSKINARFQ